MPQHKQFEKAIKVNEKARQRNKAKKSRVASVVKKIQSAETKEEALTAFRDAVSVIDSTARKGVMKKNTAARKKSRLSKSIAAME